MTAVVVAVAAFIGLLVAGHAWLHALGSEDRKWFLVSTAVTLGVGVTVAVVDANRRMTAGCASAFPLAGIILVLTAGLGPSTHVHRKTDGGPSIRQRAFAKTSPTPAHADKRAKPHHDGEKATALAPTSETGDSASALGSPPPMSTTGAPGDGSTTPRRPGASGTPPRKEASTGTAAKTVQIAHGKNNAQANGGSTASAGTSTTVPTPPSATLARPESTKQEAVGEGNAQANEGSSAATHDVMRRSLAFTLAARWKQTEVFAPILERPKSATSRAGRVPRFHSAERHMPIAISAEALTAITASTQRPTRCHRHSKKCKKKRPGTIHATTVQAALGQGNAQANDHSTANVNSNNTTNTTTSTTGIKVEAGASCDIESGHSGSATVSGNTIGGNATSGKVSTTAGGEGCNIELGGTGAAEVTENMVGGNATSGNVEITR